MTVVNPTQWYAKWFAWCCMALDRFLGPNNDVGYRAITYQRRTNLCSFAQILLGGSLATLAGITMWGGLFFTVLVLPFLLFPLMGVLETLGLVLLTIGGLALALLAIFLLIEGIERAPRAWDYVRGKVTPDMERAPTFVKVMLEYYKGVKERFCPTIEFKENRDAD